MAITKYLIDSSEVIDGTYFFLLQGISIKSLCSHTNLSAEMYAAMLLEAKLVRTQVLSDNVVTVSVNVDGWKDFCFAMD